MVRGNICQHCGQLIRVVEIPMHVLLQDVGFIHTTTSGARLDFNTMTAKIRGKSIPLTRKMWKLLAYLISAHPGVLPREVLINGVFDSNSYNSRSLDTFVASIRGKLGPVIRTHHGIGYSWSPEGKPHA